TKEEVYFKLEPAIDKVHINDDLGNKHVKESAIDHYQAYSKDAPETILLMRNHGNSLLEIASHTKKSYSTISRELSRNSTGKSYSPSKAQEKYKQRKEKQVPAR